MQCDCSRGVTGEVPEKSRLQDLQLNYVSISSTETANKYRKIKFWQVLIISNFVQLL